MKNIKLIEVKSEIGAGTRGASLGPDAIKIAALDFGSSYFKKHKSVEVPNENRLLLEPVVHDYAKRIKGILNLCERVAKEVSKSLADGKTFPIVLAGDHSSAIGTLAGIKMAYPDKRIGVIWIDAHADMHSPYTTPSGNMHGMPMAVSLGEDNMSQKSNNIDEATADFWNQLKNIGGLQPKVNYDSLVYVCVRDFEKE